ncbi:hypothetical protein HGM15179_020857, partial [Zosterops borbonicus]
PCEDPGDPPAMKILLLLFPLLLLLVQGASGSAYRCRHRGGYCTSWSCVPPARRIGICTRRKICCK